MGTVNHLEYLWLYKNEAEYHMGKYEEMERVFYQAFEYVKPTGALLQNAVALASKFYDFVGHKYSFIYNSVNTFQNQLERAINFLEKIVSFDPNTFNKAAHLLACIYIEVDRKHDAVKLLRGLHEKQPSNMMIMYNLGAALEPAEALPYLEQVVQSKDVVPQMWRTLGEVYCKTK
jgi:tetratricopeptide (TPR) repeat protein